MPKYPFLTKAMMINRILAFPPEGGVSFFHEYVEVFLYKEPELSFSLLE